MSAAAAQGVYAALSRAVANMAPKVTHVEITPDNAADGLPSVVLWERMESGEDWPHLFFGGIPAPIRELARRARGDAECAAHSGPMPGGEAGVIYLALPR